MLMEQVGTTFDYQGDDFTLERVIELGLDQVQKKALYYPEKSPTSPCKTAC